ncbi:hypothetical protein GCM10027579_16220 [Calidifontibacter terrae]
MDAYIRVVERLPNAPVTHLPGQKIGRLATFGPRFDPERFKRSYFSPPDPNHPHR